MTQVLIHSRPFGAVWNVGADDEVQELLSMVGGIIELRAINAKSRQITGREFCASQQKPGDLANVQAFIRKHWQDDIYFGPAARKDATSGGLKNCTLLRCLFCDVDFKNFPSPEIGQRNVDAFPQRPSHIVSSGGGLHCYWMLKELFHLQTEAAEAKRLLRRLAIALGGDLASAEPVHILRVPQTLNYKCNPPRLVKIENRGSAEIPYYSFADFDFLPSEATPPQPVADILPSNGDGNCSEPVSAESRLRRASAYLATIPGAIQGSGGDIHTYKTAFNLRDFGLNLDECLALMMAEFNPRCFDPRTGKYNSWSYARLKEKVANAYAYGKGLPGIMLHAVRPNANLHLAADSAKHERPAGMADERTANREQRSEQCVSAESVKPTIGFHYIEFAPTFLSVEDPPVEYLVNELLPQSVLSLAHGEPRTCKTWAALEMTIAVSTGTPPFGLERFHVPRAYPVLYSSQEDAARDVRIRAKALLAGRGIYRFPETLAFSVHKGINLDSAEWQEALIQDILKYGFQLFILDPIRRYSLNVDKGPSEVRQITAFLRRICVETVATVNICHHDTKPTPDSRDQRRRSHKASGGDWFAAAECPISFELAPDNRTLVIPEDYKLSHDPQPFIFRLDTDDPRYPATARLVGETSSAEDAKIPAIRQKVIDYLGNHSGGASGSSVIKACRIRREDGFAVLNQLAAEGLVGCIGLGGKGNKHTWILSKKENLQDVTNTGSRSSQQFGNHLVRTSSQ
jgi:hypothetical protein